MHIDIEIWQELTYFVTVEFQFHNSIQKHIKTNQQIMTKFKLRGQRVLLTRPEKKDTGIQLTPELEAELMQEDLKNYRTLEVFAVGDEVEDIKPGDIVYVSPGTLIHSEVVEVDGNEKIMVRAMAVAIIW